MATTERNYTPRPFVYKGRRWDRSLKKLYDLVQPLADDSQNAHGEGMMFEVKGRRRGLVLGGVYVGAEFDDSGARGVNLAKYTGRWHDESQRLEWSVLQSQADASFENVKMERDDRRRDELEGVLLPLRKLMHAHRHDPAKQIAITNAVTRALHVPPRADEE